MEKKQHLLDRFFAQKLQGHETKPRDAAWEKLQARLPQAKERHTRPLWGYWAVAASVAAVLTGTWFLRTKTPTGLSTPVAQTSRPGRSVQPSIGAAASEPLRTSGERSTRPVLAPGVPDSRLARQSVPTRAGNANNPLPQVPPTEPVVGTPQRLPEPVPHAEPTVPQLAKADRPEVPATDSPKASTAPANVYVLHVTEPALLAEAPATKSVEEPMPVAQSETAPLRKGKFLNRMAKNLKHLKQGEWKEAGLDAGGLLARAEEKLLHK